eukprot:TRINITY_DN6105_c0_g1_i2.p1 TRINITY_DN6105_c0_g1~~TRINITY_DN6105_c0_g1_i2.p1  ORF type:complete len:563 (-),score=90.93 TRINITY_DN6105_c0_g1_i2:242-1894(-)
MQSECGHLLRDVEGASGDEGTISRQPAGRKFAFGGVSLLFGALAVVYWSRSQHHGDPFNMNAWMGKDEIQMAMPICPQTDGSVASFVPCKCGKSEAAVKLCQGGQACTATDDTDGKCSGVALKSEEVPKGASIKWAKSGQNGEWSSWSTKSLSGGGGGSGGTSWSSSSSSSGGGGGSASSMAKAPKFSELDWNSIALAKDLIEARSCKLWGDPHIISFDQSHFVFYREGDFWLVKTSDIKIQGRFQVTDWTATTDKTDYSSMTSIKIGGSFVNDIDLEVQDMAGKILCNGHELLTAFGEAACGVIAVDFSDQGVMIDKAVGWMEHNIVSLKLPGDMTIVVNRWANFLNAEVTMHQQKGQDGVCGNFNGLASDDSGAKIHQRFGAGVSTGENLFEKPIAMKIPKASPNPQKCHSYTATKAEVACSTKLTHGGESEGWSLAECIGDLCSAVLDGAMHPNNIQGIYDKGWSTLGTHAACRVDLKDHTADGRGTAYVFKSPALKAVEDCKQLCEEREACTGVEFAKGRCELWTVPILTTAHAWGFECLRYYRDA